MDDALSNYEPEGRVFESPRAHHENPIKTAFRRKTRGRILSAKRSAKRNWMRNAVSWFGHASSGSIPPDGLSNR